MDIKKLKHILYKHVKNNKNKWQSIKHVTSNKYMCNNVISEYM